MENTKNGVSIEFFKKKSSDNDQNGKKVENKPIDSNSYLLEELKNRLS